MARAFLESGRSGVLVSLLWLLPGCRSETAGPVPELPEASWSEQVAAVRAGRETRIAVTRVTIDAAQFEQLAEGCDGLAVLEIESATFPDETLAVLAQCPRLIRLKLGVPLGDAGAAHIAAASSLEFLNLPDARFTDDGLEAIAGLPLKQLRFHSPRVTDAGMEHVAGIESLRFLHVIDVPMTDAGLLPLHAMTGLESFYLDGSACTDEGLRDLLTALPELHFHRDQLHLPGDPHAHPH